MRRPSLYIGLSFLVILSLALLLRTWTKGSGSPSVHTSPTPSSREDQPVEVHASLPQLEAPSPSVRSAAPPDKIYSGLLLKHRSASGGKPKPGPGYITRFQLETKYGFRECRLFALAYPEEAEKLASRTAQDDSADTDDIAAALYILRILAQEKREAPLRLLHQLAEAPASFRSRLALWELGEADQDGIYRALYWKKCEEGVFEAFEAIANFPDPTSVKLLERIRAASSDKSSPTLEAAGLASEALEKLRILTQPDFSTMERLLRDPRDNMLTPWAIRAARKASYPKLMETLRTRLDAGLTAGRESDSWDMSSITDPHLSSIPDHDFDEVLVAFAEMGGTLTPWERHRLTIFGYAAEPKSRLDQLLQSTAR